MEKRATADWLWSVVVLLLVMLVVTPRLTTDLYWYDEEQSMFMAGGGNYGPIAPFEMISRVADNARPPLHPVLLIGWSTIFGWSEFSTRLSALFLGLISLAMTYRLGKDLFSPRVGLLALIVMATSAFYLYYIHENRDYTLYVLLSVLAVWFYWRLIQHKFTPATQVGFVLSIAGLLYTHYMASATVVVLGIYHLTLAPRIDRWNRILFLFFVSALLFSLWVPMTIIATLLEGTLSRSMATLPYIGWSLYGYGNGIVVFPVMVVVYALIFLQRSQRVRFLLFWLVVGMLTAFVFNIIGDFLFHIRHVMFVIVPLVLLIALTIDDLTRRVRFGWIVGAAVLGIWVAAGVWNLFSPAFMNELPGQVVPLEAESGHRALDVIARCVDDDDVVLFHTESNINDRVLQYYLYRRDFRFAQLSVLKDLSYFNPDPVEGTYEERLVELVGDAARVWYFAIDSRPDPEQFALIEPFLVAQYDAFTILIEEPHLMAGVYGESSTECPVHAVS